jgi:uncharacterized UBP type Zn finger protein
VCTVSALVHSLCATPRDANTAATSLLALQANLRAFAPTLTAGRQEDAHEFLTRLLEAAGQRPVSVVIARTGVSCTYVISNPFRPQLDGRNCGGRLLRLFSGDEKSVRCCDHCGDATSTRVGWTAVELAIEGDSPSIDGLLQTHYGAEGILFSCERCRHTRSTRRLEICALPPVLVVMCKRFVWTESEPATKITKHVALSEHLDMRPYLAAEAATPVRWLLQHVGTWGRPRPTSAHHITASTTGWIAHIPTRRRHSAPWGHARKRTLHRACA